MNYQQKTLIVNTYFKYTAIYFVVAILIPVFINLNSEEESTFVTYGKLAFVGCMFMSFTMLLNGVILRGVVS
jgi:hypothetical protein